jgi:phosphoribosylaminoimidazole-succinocarboxamide synthase
MTPEEEANRGEEASRLLENPLLKNAFAAIKAEAVRQWDATGAKAGEEREWIWRHYKVIANVENILRGYVESGRIARMQLQEKETLRERTSKFLRMTA